MKKYYILLISIACIIFCSCNDYLDKEPLSNLTPEQYFTTEANIASYATDRYATLPYHGLTSWGLFQGDSNTDNMAHVAPSNTFAPGFWRVSQEGGSWEFTSIYMCNYFFDKVLPLYEQGGITGDINNIKHYIGEVYFFRAFAYFQKLRAIGDFPIVKTLLPDDLKILTEASKRSPRNEVARFILSDLDIAIAMMKDNPQGGKNRLGKDAVQLFKSRVALYEGTWLKYFKGTKFVPNGPEWPGKEKDYNANYNYPSGDIDKEIDFFLQEAMTAAKIVADKYQLVENTGTFQKGASDTLNPYFNMFGDEDMDSYSEILLWKRYNMGLGIVNSVGEFATKGNAGYGTTKSMLDAFVMKDGKPIYKASLKEDEKSSYWGDQNLLYITKNRDTRAEIFFKKPGDINLHTPPGQHGVQIEPYPEISASAPGLKYTTGYAIRKGLNFDGKHTTQNQSTIGAIIFRGVEAYLNYIEACYEKTGKIDEVADGYWKAIRRRAKINEDYNYTISLTDMNKEAETDWGAYSAGQLVDATLFNIRRERRCELMAEGFRPMDIRRWRSMDQMIDKPYHILGMNLWEEMAELDVFKDKIIEGENVSKRSFSKYLAPYHVMDNNIAYNGYRWNMAHYLEPIAIQHFVITSGGGDLDNSPIYQNPGWPMQAGSGAK